MFRSARLKLTAWYLLIIMVISLSFSTVIYRMFSMEVERVARIQRLRIERGLNGGTLPFSDDTSPSPRLILDDALIGEEQQRIILFLAVVNAGVFVLSGALGYFLAGRTLEPIAAMVDEQHRFISDASHELRTPLTALKSSLEVNIRDPNLTIAAAKTLMKESVSDVNKLQSLSDSLLQLAQYQTPKPKFSTIHLDAISQSACRQVSSLAQRKHITLANDIPSLELDASEYGILDLLVILLDNAIKYSPQRSTVRLSAKRTDGSVLISVMDTGIGINATDLPHIFDRFYRADTARSKQSLGGYGLGLSIAKQIANAHHGSISVESAPKKGTTFTVRLPIKQSSVV